MKFLDRLKSAYEAFQGREYPTNRNHRYCVLTMDTQFYADEVRLDPLTCYPEWLFTGPGYTLVCKRIENAVIYDYQGEWK
jgi:hypothetical protein